ncbi:hypothetical protein [Luteolibacter luteus]|uniref:Uncharacterized protein n=1 Tax=Luteolibacter luteus TaxID=2728835 RepID=A0A858RKH9_9BACT|nr:hypothetical protein [Luteolibacter luteus]QJE96899.1 hypothetical protein HHL09_14260 [Luteolibacter luteus]
MKPLLLLPLALLASSCFYPQPYAQQRPPMRNGEPYYPYHRGPRPPMDRYEPMDRNAPPPRDYDNPSRDGYEGRYGDDYEEPRVERTPQPAPQPQPKPQTQGRKEYPVAEKTDKPGFVISPYSPYNVIDVQDFKSGDLAKDPSNQKIFQVP